MRCLLKSGNSIIVSIGVRMCNSSKCVMMEQVNCRAERLMISNVRIIVSILSRFSMIITKLPF